MRRLPVLLWTLTALAPAQMTVAAPLCRDTKGLFTPCPQSANRTARAILSSAPARESEAAPVRRQPALLRPAFAADAPRRTRLCTDSKGLFTPCPR